MFGILREFRTLLDALVGAIVAHTDALRELARVQREAGPALERLEALELSRHQFEAEVQGALLEAKGKLRAANNSEARERQLKKSYEKDPDLFDDPGDAGSGQSPILPDDAPPSETEGLSALRLAVASSPKEAALNYKWGRGIQ